MPAIHPEMPPERGRQPQHTIDLGTGWPHPSRELTDSLAGLSADPLSAPIRSARPGARIWILDADRTWARHLQGAFEACGWQSLLMHSLPEFEAVLTDVTPDALVMEQQWSEILGHQVVQRVRAAGHRFPVVMLSSRAEAWDRIRSLEAGAHDYVAKPCAMRELMLRVECWLLAGNQRGPGLEAQAFAYGIGDLQFDPAALSLRGSRGHRRLSRGEAALLLQFCQAPGLILSREQLVRGSGSIVDAASSRSLDMRISKLRRLLGQLHAGLGDGLETVRGRGYRLTVAVERISA